MKNTLPSNLILALLLMFCLSGCKSADEAKFAGLFISMLSIFGFLFMVSGFGSMYYHRNSESGKYRGMISVIANGGVLLFWTYMLIVEWPQTQAFKHGEGFVPALGFYGVSIILYGLTLFFFFSKKKNLKEE